MNFKFKLGQLFYGKSTVLSQMDQFISINEIVENGVFIDAYSDGAFCDKLFTIGTMPNIEKFELCHREPSTCWMEPIVGTLISEMPFEIQYLLVKSGDVYFALLPLIDGAYRSCFEGSADGVLKLLVQSGDSQTTTNKVCGFYIGAGDNPYTLIENAAKQIKDKLKTFMLRLEKDVPEFSKTIGWCTYNAFYEKFTAAKLTSVLKQFNENGFTPGFMLLDAGWQTVSPEGHQMLAFEATPDKFPDGLKVFIESTKNDFNVKHFIIWHAFCGYWSGIKKENFPEYGSYDAKIHIFERYLELMNSELPDVATVGKNFYPQFMLESSAGLPDDMIGFYNDFYAYLKDQGVDGTKIDAMTWIEMLGEETGGRVVMMKKLVESLEVASRNHFNKRIINCSSCSNDMVFQSLDSNIIRSSCDYFPERPETHGKHIFINAHTSFWLGEFLMPDWDMFQSGNTAGDFHAAARAISGGPVYVTDEYQMEDYEIINKLCYKDGRVPLCTSYARVCLDSMFIDNQQNAEALKIFNTNRYGGVVGAFNSYYDIEDKTKVNASVKPSDVFGIEGKKFAVYAHNSQLLLILGANESVEVLLGEFRFELFTIAPVTNGFAPIGLVDKYNSGGTIEEMAWDGEKVKFILGEQGDFVAYCDQDIADVVGRNGEQISYELENNRLAIGNAPRKFTVTFKAIKNPSL